nr:hypothetical protein [Paracoccus saliphilus]
MAPALAAFLVVAKALGTAAGLAELAPAGLRHLAGLPQPFLIDRNGALTGLKVESLDPSEIVDKGQQPLTA